MPAIGLPASDDVYLPSREGEAVGADGGGAADVLNLAGLHSRDVEILSEDLDNGGATPFRHDASSPRVNLVKIDILVRLTEKERL